ncbi:MAG TPA: ATP-binding protein, partial [Ktedonobacterales bacterium]
MTALTYRQAKGQGRAWIRRIRLINWHGHENATLDVVGDMLAVIGENGSGKSLILDAIDWALFPTSGKVFNAAAREGGRGSKRTLSNTILFFDPHGVERPDRGWRRQRTVGYCAVEVEHEGEGRWVYGAGAAATPQSAHPFYYALPAMLEQVTFLETTPQGQAPLQMQDFRARNDAWIAAGGGVYNASQAEEYNRTVARRLLNIEGADWQRRYDALYDVLHRMLGLKVDDALVADPSGVVREFLPVVDRPHLERLVDGLEGIQRIHRDIDEYGKLRATLAGVVEARRKYHDAALRHAALVWLRAAWDSDDGAAALATAEERLREAESSARQAEAAEETAYGEESAARRELESLQQLHQGEVVQAVQRANEGLQAAQFEQDRAARELRAAEERLKRSESSLTTARQSMEQEVSSARARLVELRGRGERALGALPGALSDMWEQALAQPGEQTQADALHAAWVAADAALAGLETHARRIREASGETATARQTEREARAQHEAAARALQSNRQALWARWDKLSQRWPEGLGQAPGGEPTTIVLPPLAEAARQALDESRATAREAEGRAARLEVRSAELEARIASLGDEIGQTRSEPIPPLTPAREQALARLRTVDAAVEPAYRQLDLAREGLPWADAIEGLLAHTDTLTLLLLSVPVEQARATAPHEVDWHALVAGGGPGKAQRGSLATALVTNHADLRRHLDSAFGAVALTQEPARSGDYLCPDGRYRLGDVAGVIRPHTRAQSLIGVVRRQSAAAARREELQRDQAGAREELREAHATLRRERESARAAESRANALAEVAHMLEEVEQRRAELRGLREAEETASLRLAAASRSVEDAAREEEDARARWNDTTRDYPALAADSAGLERSRQALGQAVADAVARGAETRGRLSQLGARLRSAEESHSAESEAYGMARAYLDQCDHKASEAQRLLNEARNALRAAGLEDFEARITQLQRRLKSAEEQARKAGVAKGIALHQRDAAQQARETQAQASVRANTTLEERNTAFAALLNAVAD